MVITPLKRHQNSFSYLTAPCTRYNAPISCLNIVLNLPFSGSRSHIAVDCAGSGPMLNASAAPVPALDKMFRLQRLSSGPSPAPHPWLYFTLPHRAGIFHMSYRKKVTVTRFRSALMTCIRPAQEISFGAGWNKAYVSRSKHSKKHMSPNMKYDLTSDFSQILHQQC